MVWYLDTSAFLKLVVAEPESTAMRRWLVAHGPVWSSYLLYTEAQRAAVRLEVNPDVIDAAVDAVSMVLPSAATFFAAGGLAPGTLRSLDALHLATALEIGDDLEGLVTYDGRMAAAAGLLSIDVVAPS